MSNLSSNKFSPMPNTATQITPELSRRIYDANREAHALHLGMFPALYVELSVSGGKKKRYKANSFTRNFWNILSCLFTGTFLSDMCYGKGSLKIKSKTGTESNIANTSPIYSVSSGNNLLAFSLNCQSAATVNAGIMVGSSKEAEDFNSYKLGAEIPHNVLQRGNPVHDDNVSHDPSENTYTGVFSRVFTNITTGDVKINETGLINPFGSAANSCMWERTVLPEEITVPAGKQLKVSYSFVFHYPES